MYHHVLLLGLTQQQGGDSTKIQLFLLISPGGRSGTARYRIVVVQFTYQQVSEPVRLGDVLPIYVLCTV